MPLTANLAGMCGVKAVVLHLAATLLLKITTQSQQNRIRNDVKGFESTTLGAIDMSLPI